MKLNDFIEKLMEHLDKLNDNDKEQVREYYNEMFCEGIEQGREEENIIAGFGDPKTAAQKIKKDYQEYSQIARAKPAGYIGSDFSASEPVHTIIVEAQNIRIDVHSVSSGPVRVLFQQREGLDEVSFSTENGEFIFRHRMRNFFFCFNWFRLAQRITLEIPTDFDGNLLVKSSNSALTISGLTRLRNAQLLTSNAHINVDNVSSGSLLIQTSNAALNINNLMGDQMEAVTSNGRIAALNCDFSNALLLSTKNSSINGKNLRSDKIVLKTSNAAITGTVIGDIREYAVQSHTSNAANNLPNYSFPEQTKNFLAKTSNGRIKVDFVF